MSYLALPDLCYNEHVKIIASVIIILLLCVLALVVSGYDTFDWSDSFRPAALAMLNGGDPYTPRYGFYGPPWALLPLIPLAVLPVQVGAGLLMGANLLLLALVTRRLGANVWGLLAVLVSPPALLMFNNGNLEGLTLLGMLAPPPLAPFMFAIKPQLTVGLGIWLFAHLARRRAWRALVLTVIPISLALALSVLIFGPWFLNGAHLSGAPQNATFWPWLLPAGLVGLLYAIEHDDPRWALVVGPALSPYGSMAVWIAPLLALSPRPRYAAVACLGLWALVAILAYT